MFSDANQIRDFKGVFCARFECPPEQFEKKLFQEIFNPDMRSFSFLVRCIYPPFFQKDWEYVRKIAVTKNKNEVVAIANRLYFDPHFNRGLLRGLLRMRISGRRLAELAERIF